MGDVVLKSLLDAFLPYLQEVVVLLGSAAVLALRAYIQRRLAVAVTESTERWAQERIAKRSDPPPSGDEKRARALQVARERMPLVVRPVTLSGLETLVESAVPEGKRRASATSKDKP